MIKPLHNFGNCSVCNIQLESDTWSLYYYSKYTPYTPLCHSHAFQDELTCPNCDSPIDLAKILGKTRFDKQKNNYRTTRIPVRFRCEICDQDWLISVSNQDGEIYFEVGEHDGYPEPTFIPARRSKNR